MTSTNPLDSSHPAREKTRWTNISGGSANFQTWKLEGIGSEELRFTSTRAISLIGGTFAVLGVGVLWFWLLPLRAHPSSWEIFGEVLIFLFGMVFIAKGVQLMLGGRTVVVFDRTSRRVWRGESRPSPSCVHTAMRYNRSFGEICALQLLKRFIKNTGDDYNGDYYSWELNLVMQRGRRLHVVFSGNGQKLEEEAEELGRFLNRPVWKGDAEE